MSNFGPWLLSELESRNLNQAELARRAKSTEATISRIILGKRNPSAKLCNAIAKVLELPSELVLDKAGIIRKTGEYSQLVSTIAHRVSLLPERDQKIILRLVETWVKTTKGL